MRAFKPFFAIASFRLAACRLAAWVLTAIATSAACRDDQHATALSRTRVDAGPAAASSNRTAATHSAAPADTSPNTADPLRTAEAVSAKSIGHTSYVLKLRLEGGRTAAFKPRSMLPLGDRRYLGEIAAYRLSRALGLDNVPLAIPRSFIASRLKRAFAAPEGAEQFARTARVDPEGTVRGALVPWIDDYEAVPLETSEWRAKWMAWLTDEGPSAVPEGDRELARAVSTMLAFDCVTANWDRWSGANIARRGRQGTLLYVDNDGAFFERPPKAALAQQMDRLRRVVRFSRAFVAALRQLDGSTLRTALGDETPGHALLGETLVDGILARRSEVLAIIDAQIVRAGDTATLGFD